MKNTIGNSLTLTIFGESHGSSIGAVLDGLTPGLDVDTDYINKLLSLRRPRGSISTARREADEFSVVSGVFNGKTTGTPLTILIPNSDTRSSDYEKTQLLARPSHADFTARSKYHGFEDFRGGGHFSGRITAAIVAAAGIILPALEKKGIKIGTHVKKCAGISDRDFSEDVSKEIDSLYEKIFAVLDDEAGKEMQAAIEEAKKEGNSVGGISETVITGLPAGVGEPMFDTVEGMLSHALFAVPGVKGVEFGAGFSISDMTGKEANDPFYSDCGSIKTKTNNSGGINGGITNSMPVIFRCALRPTPTLGIPQNTVDIETKTDAVLLSRGRHDPCIVHRARIVIDSITALTVADMLLTRYGTDWLAE